jgi:hypothetical protein
VVLPHQIKWRLHKYNFWVVGCLLDSFVLVVRVIKMHVKVGTCINLNLAGRLALSCNPSYLGGQSSGMVWGGKIYLRQRIGFQGRTMASFRLWAARVPGSLYEETKPEDTSLLHHYSWARVRDLCLSTNMGRPCS